MTDFLNPLDWLSANESNVNIDLPEGDLYENRDGYDALHLILDTSAPDGAAVINSDFDNGGIKVYHFKVNGSPTYMMQNNLGDYLYPVGDVLVGLANESVYETLGIGENHSLVAHFQQATSITSVEFGATSLKPKQYSIEYKTASSNQWIPIVQMIANQQTRDFFQFHDQLNLSAIAVRLRYKGDYYASSDEGKVILSAADGITSVQKAKISRFSDFSDAADFTGKDVDADGWFDFTDDVYVYNWQLNNVSKIWTASSASFLGVPKFAKVVANKIVVITDKYCNLYDNGVITSTSIADNNDEFTSAAIHNNKLYVGTKSGKIWHTSNGSSYNIFTFNNTLTITSLESYHNLLHIGVDNPGNKAVLYAWNEISNIVTTVFKTFTQPTISALAVANESLYIGLSGSSGQNLGAIYRYNGQTCVSSVSLSVDGIDTMKYSPINTSLWVGANNGQIYLATFAESSNEPVWSTSPYYDNDSVDYYNITSDPSKTVLSDRGEANDCVWLCSDANLIAYINKTYKYADPENVSNSKTTETSYFENIPSPSTRIYDMIYLGEDVYGIGYDRKIYQINLSVIGNKEKKIYVRFQDEVGNMTPDTNDANKSFVYDDITQDTEMGENGVKISDGRIYQITLDKEIASTFVSPEQAALISPDREMTSSGFYFSNPLYVANLTRWDKISFLCNLPQTTVSASGLQNGVSVDLHIRTSNTREDLLLKDWNLPFERNTINGEWTYGDNILAEFNIAALQGKWIQYYVVLTTATRNITPLLYNVSLSYMGMQDSYFFSSVYDTVNIIGGYYNLIQNSDFEYDTVGITPVTWDSTNGLPLTVVSTDPLVGNKSMYIDGQSATAVDYILNYFEVEKSLSNRSLIIQFNYKTSADYTSGDLVVSLYNNTAGVGAITPTPFAIPANQSGGIFTATFDAEEWSPVDQSKYHDYQITFETTAGNTFSFVMIDDVYIGTEYQVVDNPPLLYRALLAANTIVSSGEVAFGYITDETSASSFDFQRYTRIVPNRFFEIPTPASKIRFGAMLITAGNTPTKICDFAVQFDAGEQDMLMMTPPITEN